MKKIILTLTIIASLNQFSTAQMMSKTANSSAIQMGIKAGFNVSNVYDSQGDQFNTDAKIGLAFGGFLAIPLSKYIGVQPEVLFSQKGFKGTGYLLGSSYSLTRTTNYIDVPLLLAIKPTPILSILVGPQFSFLLKQKDVFENSATSVVQEKEFSNDNIRKNTLCLTGGLDFNLNPIVLSARAGWDLKNNNGDGTSTTPRYKNVWYQATIGIKF